MQPKDEDELAGYDFTSTQLNQPSFIRYPRGAGVGVPLKKKASSIEIGKAEEIKKGDKSLSIWALGDFVQVACKVAQSIESKFNLSCAVVSTLYSTFG